MIFFGRAYRVRVLELAMGSKAGCRVDQVEGF